MTFDFLWNARRRTLAGGPLRGTPTWRDPEKVATYSPYVSTALLEWANVQQLWQMWTRQTAAGQNLFGWLSVCLALVVWCNFYRTVAPEKNRTAFKVTCFGVFMNLLVVLSVLYFRLTGRG